MIWKFDDNQPIYLQIVDKIKRLIITGKYPPGSKIPSVREYASDIKVNPNTIQKSLNELELLGLINTVRTNGKFVTEDQDLIEKIRLQMIEEKMKQFIVGMSELNLSKQDIIKYLESKGK